MLIAPQSVVQVSENGQVYSQASAKIAVHQSRILLSRIFKDFGLEIRSILDSIATLHANDMSTPADSKMSASEPYIVRRFAASDADSFFDAVRDSIDELAYWLPWCKPDYSIREARAWMEFASEAWESGREYPLGVFEAASGKVVGGTGVNHINKAYRTGNIGYWVSSRYTGKGIARFAACKSAVLGFEELGLTRLEIVVLTHNKASARVAEALGARFECEARNRLYFQGRPHNAFVYSLVPEDCRKH